MFHLYFVVLHELVGAVTPTDSYGCRFLPLHS